MGVIDNGHGGTVAILSGDTTVSAVVRSWSLEDTAQLHDTSVMGAGVTSRSFTPGLLTWAVTLEFFLASDSDMVAHAPTVGTGANIALKATSAATNHSYTGTGTIESVTPSRDVDQAARGTMRIRGQGVLVRPDGS